MTGLVVLIMGLAASLTAALFVIKRLREDRRTLYTQARYHTLQLEELHQQAARLTMQEAVSEAAFNCLMLIDAERNVLHINEAGRTLFRLSQGLSLNAYNSVISVTRSHEMDDMVRQLLQEANGELIEQVEIQGNTYRVRSIYTEIDGQAYVMLAMEDISELQRLGRARREFVANISHELRTPITSIRLLVDTLLREELVDTPANRSTLRKVAAETEVLHQMAQELLDLSMIESGRAEFILRDTALDEIINKATQLFTERAHRKQLTIIYKPPQEQVIILADREQIRRVVSNLLHNAIKFTPREGYVTIEVLTHDPEWVTVAVTDTGTGITPTDRERIFERFYRGDRARHSEGTGLGLAIAKHIVNAHGGSIWAEAPPQPPGARICFRVARS